MKITHKPIPEKDLTEAIKNMRIIVDTREQKNLHILQYFNGKKIPYETRKLNFGDYSCVIPAKREWFHSDLEVIPSEISLENKVCIERKHSIDEIATNLGTDRERFQAELLRIKAADCRCSLLLENFSFERVFKGNELGNYRSQLGAHKIAMLLNTFCIRYGLHLVTLDSRDYSGLMIQTMLARFVYEYLKE